MPVAVGGSVSTIEVDKLLQQLGAKVSNLRPFFHAVDADVSALLVEQFESRGVKLLGSAWAELSPGTIAVRIAQRILSARGRARAHAANGRDTPLYDSGGLFASFTKPGSPWSVREIGAMEYVRGSQYAPGGVPVAALMQSGFMSPYKPVFNKQGDAVFIKRPEGPKHVPARPIIPNELPLPVLNAWEGQLVSYIESGALN